MTALPVYTGVWTDQSQGAFLGRYHTYTRRETQFLLGATAAFLTYVGGCAWTIYAFLSHARLAQRNSPDMMTLQHRSIYRNSSTAQSAILDGLNVYLAWKPWKLCSRPRKRSRQTRYVGLRSCELILPAFVVFGFFTAASVVSTLIATPIYTGNAVLLKDGLASGRCGVTTYDGSLKSQEAVFSKTANDTHAAISYSRSCYSGDSTIFNSVSCHSFVKPKLNYTRDYTYCPFGDPQIPFEDSICNINNNNAAYRLTSEHLDSNKDFGINAAPKDRVQVSKQLVCSPLNWKGFNSTREGEADETNILLTDYKFGPVVDIFTPGSNYTDWTYENNPSARDDYVSFDVFAVTHNATGPATLWRPVPALDRSDADVTIIFVAPNSITYRDQVEDPFFSATWPYTAPGVVLPGTVTTYSPDDFVSIMGCTEQYKICIDKGSRCSPYSGQAALPQLLHELHLNMNQYLTAQRLLSTISVATVYSSVAGIGPDALRLWSQVYQLVAPGLPRNQWQLEVDGWHETTLAKWQALTVEFAANPYAAAHPPEHGPFLVFPDNNATLDAAWHSQCRNQLISNLGAYQNVSIVGLVVIYSVGGLIILISWVLTMGFAGRYGGQSSRWAWRIDGKLQAQRVGLLGAGFRDLDGSQGEVPTVPRESEGRVPVRIVNSALRGGLVFVPKMNAESKAGSADEGGEKALEGDLEGQTMHNATKSEESRGVEMTSLEVRTVAGPWEERSRIYTLLNRMRSKE
ncbi:hypothetical protein H2200_001913 [Cladophialophora chaetospira]|uniref:Uncharacterized protein n=1 Tax=Cladophialophora chaetospira TaxID=386627 RepID=A0AA39CPI1_9EURO|nr:hypothetical protein H2200_001913 [Cladophialophora chaetospira]